MSRLTVHWNDLTYDTFDPIDLAEDEYSRVNFEKVLMKLGKYEDLEEQGLLPRFHLGDEFWTTMIDRVVKAKVVMLQQKKDGSWIYRLSCEITKDYHDTINYEERKYGKCFFDTKEEAEEKLKELQNE